MSDSPKVFEQLYPNRFLKAGLLMGKHVPLVITDVCMEELEDEKKGKIPKAILSFSKTPKKLVLCKLNGICIKAMFGGVISNWIGKTVVLFATDTIQPMHGEECIRIWGSPDIPNDINVRIKQHKKKEFFVLMHKTEKAMKPEEVTNADNNPQP